MTIARATSRLSWALLLPLVMTACNSAEPIFGIQDIDNDDFAPELGIDLAAMTQTASGMWIQDIVVGEGTQAFPGRDVTVDYAGFLANGTRFDAGEFTFRLGVGQVIPGFDEGIAGMLVGGVRKLVIPPELGYRDTGSGPIPPNAILIFDVELLAVSP
jgi:FKBP-type peptidyl-prolyl cis-trans isomerase FkpA